MPTKFPISPPTAYVAPSAIGFADSTGELALVAENMPLPVAARRPEAPPALAGLATTSSVVGPFTPLLDAPIHLELGGTWTGRVELQRSTDGGATRRALTAGGMPWASYTGEVNEVAWQEGESGATFYLDIALDSGIGQLPGVAMSAFDFTARALALRAVADNPLTFVEAQQARLPATMTRFDSNGHFLRGLGVATYVADDLATEALGAAHPSAVIAGAGDSYFRLIGDSNGYITPEQLGCPSYAPGTDQLPWLQAAIDYVAALPDLNGVLLTQRQYELWRTDWTGSGADYANPGSQNSSGNFLLVSDPVRIVGAHPNRTILRFKGPTGGSLLTDYTVVNGTSYGDNMILRGHGFLLWGTVSDSDPPQPVESLPALYLENVTLSTGMVGEQDAAWPATVSNPNSWDITNKGVSYRNDRQAGRIELCNVTIDGFLGEAVYMGGTFANGNLGSELVARNLTVLNSNASALNPNGPAVFDVDGFYVENCRASLEGWAGWVLGRLVNATFRNCTNGGIAGSNVYMAPRRNDNSQPLLWIDNVVVQDCGDFYPGSYLKGRMHLIDTRLILTEAGSIIPMKDIDLDVTIECDTLTLDGAIHLGAHASAPAQSVENVQIRALLTRSSYARANTKFFGTLVVLAGSLGPNNSLRLKGDIGNILGNYTRIDSALTHFRPRILDDGLGGTWNELSGGGSAFSFNAVTTPTPEFGHRWLQSTFGGAGVTTQHAVTPPAVTWFNDGHEVTIEHNDGTCPAASLLVDGRVVVRYRDKTTLRANKLHNRWDVVQRPRELVGSAVIDAPNIAAGAVATIGTITVAGAVVGDFVRIVAGLALTGLHVWGEVTAADTVTVYGRNNTGSGINLASTTYRARVDR